MRIEGRYDSKSHAKLALRRWRGLYGDPEADPENRWFRVRFLPHGDTQFYSWAVVSFTDCEEADACNEQGEITKPEENA